MIRVQTPLGQNAVMFNVDRFCGHDAPPSESPARMGTAIRVGVCELSQLLAPAWGGRPRRARPRTRKDSPIPQTFPLRATGGLNMNENLNPVLIAGAGPTGMMAAIELSRFNIPVRLI